MPDQPPDPRAPPAPAPRPAAADGLLHPLILLSVPLLLFNDHHWKGRGPGWATGKLSDLAGLIFAPALLVALVELLGAARGRRWAGDRRLLLFAVLATGAVFSVIQLDPWAAAAWRWGLGLAQWPIHLLAASAAGEGWAPLRPVAHTMDPLDLWTLPALFVPLWTGWRRGG